MLPAESALHPIDGHRFLRDQRLLLPSANGRKNEPGVAVRCPITPKQGRGELRQGGVPVLGSFASMDMDHLPRSVDIGDFEE